MNTKTTVATICVAAIGLITAATRAPGAEQATLTVWDGVYSVEQAARGKELYDKECSKCHAADLSGMDEAPPIAGGAFLANWDGLSVGDLSERVRISMPPNRQPRLSKQQVADVLSYVFSVNNFPVGKTELDPKTELLKQIQIVASKPKSSSGS